MDSEIHVKIPNEIEFLALHYFSFIMVIIALKSLHLLHVTFAVANHKEGFKTPQLAASDSYNLWTYSPSPGADFHGIGSFVEGVEVIPKHCVRSLALPGYHKISGD